MTGVFNEQCVHILYLNVCCVGTVWLPAMCLLMCGVEVHYRAMYITRLYSHFALPWVYYRGVM